MVTGVIKNFCVVPFTLTPLPPLNSSEIVNLLTSAVQGAAGECGTKQSKNTSFSPQQNLIINS